MNKTVVLLAALIVISGTPTLLQAGEETADTKKATLRSLLSDVVGHYPLRRDEAGDTHAEQKTGLRQPKNWEFDFGMQRFIMSHTSYEFGNPFPPFQKPLSRLEFPLDTWWLDFRLRRTCPRWSIGGRAGLSVARNTDGWMRDSDWELDDRTEIKNTYSESRSRAEQNYLFRGDVDVNISDWLRLPPSLEIRPLFAFQFQRLSLMAHDGVQWTYNPAFRAVPLPGDGIHFRQDYYLYLIGLRGSYELFKLGKHITIKTLGEADWGPALGYNEDHHLLREGDRFTYEKTSGNALYFSAGLDMIIAKTFTAGVTMDYQLIRTSGVHKLSNIPMREDESWSNGVRVWSDQTSLIARISYAF